VLTLVKLIGNWRSGAATTPFNISVCNSLYIGFIDIKNKQKLFFLAVTWSFFDPHYLVLDGIWNVVKNANIPLQGKVINLESQFFRKWD
jgi:hypothetical protein